MDNMTPTQSSPPAPSSDAPALTLREKLTGAVRLGLAAVAIVLAAFAFTSAGAPLTVGVVAPPLHLSSYDGKEWDLSAFEGQAVVVNFWASWCPPCLRELPDLKRVAQAFDGEVTFIGAVVNSAPQEVFSVLRRTELPYPVAAAHRDSVQTWQATSVPITVVLDRSHRVVWSTRGAVSEAKLSAVLVEHLGLPAR